MLRLHRDRSRGDGPASRTQVINFYLALLQDRELALNGKQPRVHFHNTFFYNKLYADSGEYNFKAVQRWTSEKKLGYSILDCDLVVIPVHQVRSFACSCRGWRKSAGVARVASPDGRAGALRAAACALGAGRHRPAAAAGALLRLAGQCRQVVYGALPQLRVLAPPLHALMV